MEPQPIPESHLAGGKLSSAADHNDRSLQGLSDQEAARRLSTEGWNELPSAKPRTNVSLVLGVLREPMLLILLATGSIYVFLGDPEEAIALLVAVFLIIGIEFYQERKTERALEALRNLSSPRALVIREGVHKRIPGREVVTGDLVIVSEGDRVPADGFLLTGSSLSVDESLLTGESVPVRKCPGADGTTMGVPGGDDRPFLFSGTLVVQGKGIARVEATGVRTEMGRIGKTLLTLETERTPLQRETDRWVRFLAVIGLSLCVLVAVIYGITRGSWMNGILAGLTLAISMVPEEFPVVLTVFLALGAWRIARAQVLTRRVPAVEMLGAATVLCVDKTGTLTLNRMSVRQLYAGGLTCELNGRGDDVLPEDFHEVLEYSILASHRDPFDPTEKAFIEFGLRFLRQTEHLHDDWQLVREYPLTPELLVMSRAWRAAGTNGTILAAKGAPEAVLPLCRLTTEEAGQILRQATAMASDGLRVLAVARSNFPSMDLPDSQLDYDFQFVGLVGLADPVRPGVPEAIRQAQQAGIRVVMITGDYPPTAKKIARLIGLEQCEICLTGSEIAGLDKTQLREQAARVNVFARVVPEQKLRLVEALKINNEVVAMTGDGVNDAPALKAAHIGIAMGGRGTDVARESAALVLLDDNFVSIVQAVRLGRRIFDNLERAMTYLLAAHIPIAGITLLPLLLGWPLILMPLHILFLEMIIDPACSIVFEAEAEDPGIMNRPPRDSRRPLFTRRNLFLGLAQGAGVLLTVLAVFWWTVYGRYNEFDVRAITFATLIITNLALILVNRSWSRTVWSGIPIANQALGWVVVGAMTLLAAVLYLPPLPELFRFSTLHSNDIGVIFAAGLGGLLLLEAIKIIVRGHSVSAPGSFKGTRTNAH
ncbi:MAG: cation-translocating P-type ATPase [Acidobacteria bacterium]|nr:cation-translocating P-type ATPase [Acidobacteriota bacterium]